MEFLTTYAVVIVRVKVSLCIVKNPEDADIHTSGDSTAGIQFHLLLSKKGVPRSLYEDGVSFTFCDTSGSLSLQATDESLYEK